MSDKQQCKASYIEAFDTTIQWIKKNIGRTGSLKGAPEHWTTSERRMVRLLSATRKDVDTG